MNRFSLISALCITALFAGGPMIAATAAANPVFDFSVDTPAGIAAAIGFNAMTLDVAAFGVFTVVAMIALLLAVIPTFRPVGYAASGLTGQVSGRDRRPLWPGEVMLRKPPG